VSFLTVVGDVDQKDLMPTHFLKVWPKKDDVQATAATQPDNQHLLL
jgi:hypothetical protein